VILPTPSLTPALSHPMGEGELYDAFVEMHASTVRMRLYPW